MSSEDATTVELDDTARQLLDDFERATETVREWGELKEKAKQQLLYFLRDHDADVGTVEGEPAVSRGLVDYLTLDRDRLRKDEPAMFDAYKTRRVTYWRLDSKRRGRHA